MMACELSNPIILRLEVPQRRSSWSGRLRCYPGIFCLKKNFQPRRKFVHQHLPYRTSNKVVQAAVLPVEPVLLDNEEKRKELSEKYGFAQIGEPLPDDVTLKDIMDSLPKKVFEIDDLKAWKSVLISVTSYALGIFVIAKAPWYLLPLAWAWTGTAATGFFVIGMTVLTSPFQGINWWKILLELLPFCR
uniref:Uncharacterized protein n=1 Tax=Ananas comosus var. bracteatus TaxID=296719 RepID=A0A6V7P4S6_ANACO|nr:unnamed protein product [Ananas comosus var. bracteatus]